MNMAKMGIRTLGTGEGTTDFESAPFVTLTSLQRRGRWETPQKPRVSYSYAFRFQVAPKLQRARSHAYLCAIESTSSFSGSKQARHYLTHNQCNPK
jgi:hypothetical protein